MLRNLYDTLRIKYAVWKYDRHRNQHDQVTTSQALETLRGMGDTVDVQARLRQAALLEANDVPESLVHLICAAYSEGRITTSTLHSIQEHGITVDLGLTVNDALRASVDNVRNIGKIHRLQQAVKRLAFIAGPGFTTDHLIDEGIVKQGDI